MRVTSSMYYENLYGSNNSKLNQRLFDVNKQIASGLKIQYASDDISVFTETMRLDNEITTLKQIKQSTESGYKISNQSDVILNDFTSSMSRFRTLMLSAANGTNDQTSLNSISSELRGIEKHFKHLANTSINGQYLFSGSAIDIKPIDEDGNYHGNDVAMNAFLGSNSQQQYNVTGADLFLGDEIKTQRQVTSNVSQASNVGTTLDSSTTMADFMGVVPVGHQHNFYLRGVQSNGNAFNTAIRLDNTATVAKLLEDIGTAYGNTSTLNVVNVSMSSGGQIVIEDKLKGSSKLDFHMVGASDFGGADEALITNIDELVVNGGSTDYATAQGSATQLYVREFNKSPYSIANGASSSLAGRVYDRTEFEKDGSTLSASISQVIKGTNAFATASTKISEVADLSQGTAGTLDGTKFILDGTKVGGAAFAPPLEIDFKDAGSTFSLDGGATNYNIYSADAARTVVSANDMTYQQLTDVINMAISGNLPATVNSSSDYDNAIESSNGVSNTYLKDGKLTFKDLSTASTLASISLYDSNSGAFGGDSSVLSFNANSALTVSDPKTDFFKMINEMVTAVEDFKLYPDTSSGHVRNIGIENSIKMMDNLQDHVFRIHSLVGAQSNTLTHSLERTELLKISTMTLRSSVIDTDLAEASLELTQLTLNFEAMLSTVGRVSKLSLVNYL